MQVSVHAAKTHLSRLIEAALAGEEVIIAKGSKPVVRLVAIAQGGLKLGVMKDELGDSAPDFLEPMGDDDVALWEGGA